MNVLRPLSVIALSLLELSGGLRGYLWTPREACETPKWMGYTGMGDLSKRECRPIDLEPGVDFWVFSQVEWRADWNGGAHWIGSDRREICDE
jgi:hypothetical protein